MDINTYLTNTLKEWVVQGLVVEEDALAVVMYYHERGNHSLHYQEGVIEHCRYVWELGQTPPFVNGD